MSLGHREDVWTNPKYHGVDAGRHQVDPGPGPRRRHAQPRAFRAEEAKAKADVAAAKK